MDGGYGWIHDYVELALAAKLGLTEEDVEKELEAGKPRYQIALDNGIAQDDLATFMNDVHKEAFAQAVKGAIVTQEQSAWMLGRVQICTRTVMVQAIVQCITDGANLLSIAMVLAA